MAFSIDHFHVKVTKVVKSGKIIVMVLPKNNKALCVSVIKLYVSNISIISTVSTIISLSIILY